MKLSYFQLLSGTPIYMPNVGGILSPTLQSIADIGGTDVYQNYLSILIMDVKQVIDMQKDPVEDFEIDESVISTINIFDMFVADSDSASALQSALNFFIQEDVVYSSDKKIFEVKGNIVVKEGDSVAKKYVTIGVISRENYRDVVDVICQRNNIQVKASEDLSKAKSKKALAILEKIKKGREKMAKSAKADKNMELGNIISAVANKSQSLNIINIWNLTVYQLWDCFARLNNLNAYQINAASVSAWGDKDKKFNFNDWFKRMND